MIRRLVLVGLLAVGLAGGTAAAQDWLALCSKCLNPSVFNKTGIGTANAVAEARITRADAEGHCANWSPGENVNECARREVAAPEAQRTYRATADCIAGRITPIDGKTYRLDGVWNGDIGHGRTRWKDASGRVVGRDNASGGLGISQQWEVLCPKAAPASARPAASAARPTAPAAQATGGFRVGQVIEAQYGRQWVRGKVTRIQQITSAQGIETRYEVALENRQRGVLPARMLRAPVGG